MGFRTADMPPVDPAEYESMPFMDRMRMLATHWVEYGFGGPKQMHMLYVYKLLFYVVAGVLVVGATTPGLSLVDLGGWWGEPIVYEKLIVWTLLFEVTGYASSSGPLAFKFAPFTGGWRYWTRRNTLRLPPWPDKVPFTAGDHRTVVDVTLYGAILVVLVGLLVAPGTQDNAFPGTDAGLIHPMGLLAYVVLICVMGLRDRVVYLAARSEQYVAILFFFAVLSSPVDMILAAKIAMVTIWMGAGVSKFGHHFTSVVPPMMSNTPWITSTAFKRKLYRSFPDDLRPSRLAWAFAHIGGTVVELCLPVVLLFSTNSTVTWLAIAGMILFHVFITSTFPLAVPLEWNVFFMFATAWLFAGFPAGEGYAIGDVSSPLVLTAIAVAFLSMPILGNLRPDLVSFLPSMRQYAGNWASATWAFRGDAAEDKLNQHLVKANANQVDQLAAAYGKEVAEIFMQKAMAWRTMHSQGRALMSLMMRHLDRLENYRIREGEFTCTTLIGWQFGDAHLHNEQTITAVQKRCGFEPGECIIVWIESQPIHRKRLEYKVIDAAVGVVERGHYHPADAVDEQPWLPNGPIPHTVTWRRDGYVPSGEWAHPSARATVGA
ncbi:DUF3556 domain-containing protein [Euzebya rosea]|uniref:DUF3556 domain-containing protein n=1 Tax=Euzebya rosea TaxID=2052804 RepID=UPI000D3E1120|nr:DUF3556 domain-containing protein [Euzebya rosea]